MRSQGCKPLERPEKNPSLLPQAGAEPQAQRLHKKQSSGVCESKQHCRSTNFLTRNENPERKRTYRRRSEHSLVCHNRSMRRLFAILAAAAVFALPAFPADDEDLTRLRIEVKDLKGKPVERANVIVKFVQGRSIKKFGKLNKKSWELKTNQEGWVTLPPLPKGTVVVQIIAKNYQTYGETFDIQEDEKTIQVQLKPPQPQYSAHQ
jgi:hypothetical protein